jgi:putative dimethyl sulfoxide reductase chaperone
MTSESNNKETDRRSLLKGYNMLLYFAGSMIMYEPTEECVVDFLSDGILRKLPLSSSNPRFIQAAAFLREPCIDKDMCRETLVKDFRCLFSSDGLKLAFPHESAYPEYSLVYGTTSKVSEFYDSYGWKSRTRANVPEDHLGIEILFLTKLVDKYLQFDDDPCCCEMQKEIRRFIGQHILTWLPEWNRRVLEHAKTLSYRGIGTLIHACVEDIYGIFDNQGKPL